MTPDPRDAMRTDSAGREIPETPGFCVYHQTELGGRILNDALPEPIQRLAAGTAVRVTVEPLTPTPASAPGSGEIQRWRQHYKAPLRFGDSQEFGLKPDAAGPWVRYDDHFAALQRARAEGEAKGGREAHSLPELVTLHSVVLEARRRWSRVDNGYCSVCGAHRLHHDGPSTRGTLPALPSLCENPKCFSHELDSAAALAEGGGE